MKTPFLAGLALLSTSAALAQNAVTINQSGGPQANRAVVSQSGSGNSIVINQTSSTNRYQKPAEPGKDQTDTTPAGEGNQVSLRVDENTQTTINQHNSGPNSVEIWQPGNSSATINQSSDTHENTVVTHPQTAPSTPRNRSTKRRHRP